MQADQHSGEDADLTDAPPINRGIASSLLAAQLRRGQTKIYKHFETWFAADDMTPLQFSTLNLIDLNPGMSQKLMASYTKVERASFGECLARLEDKGLILRRPDPNDRRAKVMSLTAEGRRVLDRILSEIRAQEIDCAKRLSEAERQQLLALLAKMNGLTERPAS